MGNHRTNAASVKSSLDFPHSVVITFIGNNCDSSHEQLVIGIQQREQTHCLYILPPGAELIKDRGIIYEGQTWKAGGCDFYFNGSLNYQECPLMTRPVCYIFNGFVCCASQCPGRMPASVF